MRKTRWLAASCLGWCLATGLLAAAQDDFDREPIAYSQTQPKNAVSQLREAVLAGAVTLPRDEHFGYLPAVLQALDVPESSQLLVFSKTSLQRHRISPRTPRALYYNDDVYIGYCHLGDVLEVSVADPALGTVFYTLDQSPDEPPTFVRQGDNCLICHGGSQTRNVPGHLVRSTYPDASGQPILTSGTYRTDHSTPLEHRWGGWYVTGTHGAQTHLGNRIYRGRPQQDEPVDVGGFNVTELESRFRTSNYLTPHSDLAAMLVLEHQAGGHNVLTRASFSVRAALYREDSLNRELQEPAGHRWDSTNTIIRSAAESLVRYFLFSGETPLQSPVAGTTTFAREFALRGPRHTDGRSLRELDLNTRLFRFPCSYLIYTESFTSLPAELKSQFWQQMDEILSGRDASREFEHLTVEDRRAIQEILLATMPGLPAAWGR